jgi:hypothetical protein
MDCYHVFIDKMVGVDLKAWIGVIILLQVVDIVFYFMVLYLPVENNRFCKNIGWI